MSRARNYGLDLLRIVLCLSIVLFHYEKTKTCAGSVSVDGFYTLCGFCAAISLKSNGIGPLIPYYKKKAWRLLPLMILSWVYANVWCIIKSKPLLLPNICNAISNPSGELVRITGNCAVWFLAALFVYFAIFPLLAYCYRKRYFVWILAAVFLFGMYKSFSAHVYEDVSFRMWQLLFGMWCASWNVKSWNKKSIYAWIVIGSIWVLLSSILTTDVTHKFTYTTWGYFTSTIVFGFLISCLWNVTLPAISDKTEKIIGLLSGMTYAIFIVHVPMMLFFDKIHFNLAKIADFLGSQDALSYIYRPLAFCATLLVSYFLYEYVEVRWVGRILSKRKTNHS